MIEIEKIKNDLETARYFLTPKRRRELPVKALTEIMEMLDSLSDEINDSLTLRRDEKKKSNYGETMKVNGKIRSKKFGHLFQ